MNYFNDKVAINFINNMPTIKFTSALTRFFPTLEEGIIAGQTIQEVFANLENKYPGINDFLRDDTGHIRQHVNIFLKGELIEDEATLSDRVGEGDEILIFQALSGG